MPAASRLFKSSMTKIVSKSIGMGSDADSVGTESREKSATAACRMIQYVSVSKCIDHYLYSSTWPVCPTLLRLA